jgi:hypothetical protein
MAIPAVQAFAQLRTSRISTTLAQQDFRKDMEDFKTGTVKTSSYICARDGRPLATTRVPNTNMYMSSQKDGTPRDTAALKSWLSKAVELFSATFTETLAKKKAEEDVAAAVAAAAVTLRAVPAEMEEEMLLLLQTCDASSFEDAVNRLQKAKGSHEALARKHAQDAWPITALLAGRKRKKAQAEELSRRKAEEDESLKKRAEEDVLAKKTAEEEEDTRIAAQMAELALIATEKAKEEVSAAAAAATEAERFAAEQACV